MGFISSGKFIFGYLIGAAIMWAFMVFDYGARKDKVINELKQDLALYQKSYMIALSILEDKERELEKERNRVCEIQKKQIKEIYYRESVLPSPEQRGSRSSIKSNRIRGLAGFGPNGLEVTDSSISVKRSIVGGIGYDRLVTDKISLGIEVFTNWQIIGTVGIDF